MRDCDIEYPYSQEQNEAVFAEFIAVIDNLLGTGVLGTSSGRTIIEALLERMETTVNPQVGEGTVIRHAQGKILKTCKAEIVEAGGAETALLETFDHIYEQMPQYESNWFF